MAINSINEQLAVCGYSDLDGKQDQFQQWGFDCQLQCVDEFEDWLKASVEVKTAPFFDGFKVSDPILK